MRWILPLALLATTAPALAQDSVATTTATAPTAAATTAPAEPFQQTIAIACRFTWECVENEPCTETEFTPDITGTAGGASADALTVQSQMVSDAETVDMTGTKQVKALSLTGGGFDARHLLSIATDGASRYTVHYADGPIVISYLGTCK